MTEGKKSKHRFSLFKSTDLEKPWREVPWETNEDLDYVKDYKPHSEAQHLRILLHGPPGSGKSSFINSVDSALRAKITAGALAANSSGSSFTNTYTTFHIERDKPGDYYPIVFGDTMGVEKGTGKGVAVENIKQIIKGNVRDGCTLTPGAEPSGFHLNRHPTINDKVHVLVSVFSAANLNMAEDDDSIRKILEIRTEVSKFGIPQVAILTHIDKACPKVQKKLRTVYESKYVKKQMETLSASVGIPMNCIFPVKNYSEETKTDKDIDTLIMNAMRKIIDYGEDYLNRLAFEMNCKSVVPV